MARSTTPTVCPIREVLDSLPAPERAELEDVLADDISSVAIASWAIGRGHRKASVPAVAAHRYGQCECRQSKELA